MLQHLFRSYGTIGKIYLEENAVKMMGTYDHAELLARLTDHLKRGREFSRVGRQTISNAMMASKGITLLAETETFNEDIRG